MRSYFGLAIWAACLIFIGGSFVASGGEFRSTKGYQVTYPEGWVVATKEDQQALSDAARELVKNVDLSRMDVMLYDSKSEAATNVNIIVVDPAPINSKAVAEVKAGMQQQAAQAGLTFANLECNLAKIGNNDAIVSTWRMKMPPTLGSVEVMQKQVIIASKEHGYIITCSSSVESYNSAVPVFDQILQSFKPDKGPFGSNIPSWLKYAVVGGLIGAVVSMLKYGSRNKNQASGGRGV